MVEIVGSDYLPSTLKGVWENGSVDRQDLTALVHCIGKGQAGIRVSTQYTGFCSLGLGNGFGRYHYHYEEERTRIQAWT